MFRFGCESKLGEERGGRRLDGPDCRCPQQALSAGGGRDFPSTDLREKGPHGGVITYLA